MRRLLFLTLCAALLLGACSPTVTLLGSGKEPTPLPASASLPPPAARTPVPTPTRAASISARPDMLKGTSVLVWHGWDGQTARLFEQMAGEFNLSNAWGIKVTVTSQHNLNQLAAAVDKSLGEAPRPEIIVALPEQILAWQDKVLDLEPYLLEPAIGFDAAELPEAFGAQSLINGVRYGLPASRSARFIFYNLSFAKDLGFSTPPQSQDDFRKQACAANGFWKSDDDLTNDGFGGLALDVAPNWQSPYAWLTAGGGQIFSDGEFHFNSPANLNALLFVNDLREASCAWLPDTASNEEHLASRRALFITGSLGSIAGQTAALSAAASPDQWTLLPYPGQTPVVPVYGPDFAVLKSDDARQLASWLFIRWMLEPQNQVRWSLSTGLLPVTTTAIQALKANTSLPLQTTAALDLIRYARTYPQSPAWGLADKILADGFAAYFRNYPLASLAGVLDQMDATFQDLGKK